jgi:hypothetical protein
MRRKTRTFGIMLRAAQVAQGVPLAGYRVGFGDGSFKSRLADKCASNFRFRNFPQAHIWTATALLVRSAVSIDYWDLGPRVPRSSNAQSPAIYERTIRNGPIDVTRPPSYRSGGKASQESH